ncbi:hypothetical protein DPEC_G00374850, partial [Dallia pectoralis]
MPSLRDTYTPAIGSAITLVSQCLLRISELITVRTEPAINVTHTVRDHMAPSNPHACMFHNLIVCTRTTVKTSALEISSTALKRATLTRCTCTQ